MNADGASSGSSLANKVNAAPFVPGAAGKSPDAGGSQGKLSSDSVKAQPFVPGGGKAGQGNGAGGRGSQGTKLAAGATTFVPKGPEQQSGAKGGRKGHQQHQHQQQHQQAQQPQPQQQQQQQPQPQQQQQSQQPAQQQPQPQPQQQQQAPVAQGPPATAGRGPMPGRGGRGGSPASPFPMNAPGRGMGPMGRSGRGGRGDMGRGGRGGRGGFMPGLPSPAAMGMGMGMHPHAHPHSPHHAAAMMMLGGPPGPVGPAHGLPMAFGAGGGGHIPMYRPHEQYIVAPGRAYAGIHFMEESLRMQLQQRAYMAQAQWHDESDDAPPPRLGPYHSLYPLEEGAMGGSQQQQQGGPNDMPSAALGVRTSLVKGVSSADGLPYALRRIDPKQVIPTAELLSRCRDAVEAWAPLANHPHLVGLRAAFVAADSLGGTGQSDGASALVLAQDFYAGAITLAAAHLLPQMTSAGLVSAPQPPPEEVLWSYCVQLASVLRAVHGCGLLLRPAALHPTKMLLTGFGRLRCAGAGLVDALLGEPPPGADEMPLLVRQDLTAMGQLLLTLACAGSGLVPSLELMMANHYSPELTRLVGALLAAVDGGPLGSWRGLVGALADRAFTELDGANVMADTLVVEASKEVENGRLLRLLAKLSFVTERPAGLDGSDQWSETGDRYLLKLFRDFVFHNVSPEGGPLLDWAHVVEALNKLDAGVSEEVLLLSRDEQSVLVVTYADIKRCLETAFGELKTAQQLAAAAGRQRLVVGGRMG